MSAELPGVFDPSQHNASMAGGNALPISDKKGHLVVITDSDFKQNSKGTGNMLALTLYIQDGVHAGQEGEWNLSLGHSNAIAAKIAQQELACICKAVGHLTPLQNTEPLHNKPFRVCVRQQKKNPEYTEVFDVLRADGSKLSDLPGSAAPTGPASPPPAPPAPVAATGFPPAAPAVSEVTTAVQPVGMHPQAAPAMPPAAQPPVAAQWPPQPAQPAAPQQQPVAAAPGQAPPWNAAPPQ